MHIKQKPVRQLSLAHFIFFKYVTECSLDTFYFNLCVRDILFHTLFLLNMEEKLFTHSSFLQNTTKTFCIFSKNVYENLLPYIITYTSFSHTFITCVEEYSCTQQYFFFFSLSFMVLEPWGRGRVGPLPDFGRGKVCPHS